MLLSPLLSAPQSPFHKAPETPSKCICSYVLYVSIYVYVHVCIYIYTLHTYIHTYYVHTYIHLVAQTQALAILKHSPCNAPNAPYFLFPESSQTQNASDSGGTLPNATHEKSSVSDGDRHSSQRLASQLNDFFVRRINQWRFPQLKLKVKAYRVTLGSSGC